VNTPEYYNYVSEVDDDFFPSWLAVQGVEVDQLKDKQYISQVSGNASNKDKKSMLLMFFICKNKMLHINEGSAWCWLQSAVDSGLAEAEYVMGQYLTKNILQKKQLLESAANKGMDLAQIKVAKGLDLEGNTEASNKFYQLAAKQGNLVAMIELAKNYEMSDHGFEAFNLYKQASESQGASLNIYKAKYELAKCFAKGIGCERSIKSAVELYKTIALTTQDELDDVWNDFKLSSQLLLIGMMLSDEYSMHIDAGDTSKILTAFKNSSFSKDIINLSDELAIEIENAIKSELNLINFDSIINGFGKKIEIIIALLAHSIEAYKKESDLNKKLEEKNTHLNKLQNRMQKLVDQFMHTLGNVIFPDTIYQVAERLKNKPECRKDVLLLHEVYHSEIIIKLQGELLRHRYVNTNPENFRMLVRKCRRTPDSADNTKSIEDILDYAASRVTARFLNQNYAGLNSIRDKILSKKNVNLLSLKQKFEDDILLNKFPSIPWVNKNLRPIKITEISPSWKKIFLLSESHVEALLFGYFSEILFNAFKYADHDKNEFLTISFSEIIKGGETYLSCKWENPVKDNPPHLLGTGEGLGAIREDLKQLNGIENPEESLLISQKKNKFQVTLFFKKDLLVNELPTLKIKRKANMEK